MEVEAMNFMEDDSVRKRVSIEHHLKWQNAYKVFSLYDLDVKIQVRLWQIEKEN